MEASDLRNRLTDFQLVAGEVLRDVKDITPQQVKHWIVNPFLVSLGWDPHDKKQVFLDFAVKPEGHVDYALLDTQGKARLVLEVRPQGLAATEISEAAKKAQSVEVPLLLVTNGQEFALWYLQGSGAPAPLFALELKDLANNADMLLGLTADFRLSDTGIEHLRRATIRLAVLQFLEENSEQTFEAIVNWVTAEVAPESMDEATDEAIREATLIWLTEEGIAIAALALGEARRPHEFRVTTAKDWEPFPRGPAGAFQYKYDTSKTLDLRLSPKEVKDALRVEGLKMPTPTAFGGFYYTLRRRAGLPSGRHHSGGGEKAHKS